MSSPASGGSDGVPARAAGGDDGLEVFLGALTRGGDGRLLEIRARRAQGGMTQRFVACEQTRAAARQIRSLGERTDVYVGVLARDRASGGRDAISRGQVVFVEVDATAAGRLLDRAPATPSIVVASGTPGHLHAYWLLSASTTPERVQEANRKLALAVGGDMASVDCARILRPPGTTNHKHGQRRPVRLIACDPTRVYALDELTRGLKDPRAAAITATLTVRETPARRAASPAGAAAHAQLREIPTAHYVQWLTGQEPNREGKVRCPFHEGDRTPSLQCYDDGTFCCFGCRKGGTIIDFAAGVWGMSTKGRDFIALRTRLADTFGLTAPEAARQQQPAGLRATQPVNEQEVSR